MKAANSIDYSILWYLKICDTLYLYYYTAFILLAVVQKITSTINSTNIFNVNKKVNSRSPFGTKFYSTFSLLSGHLLITSPKKLYSII